MSRGQTDGGIVSRVWAPGQDFSDLGSDNNKRVMTRTEITQCTIMSSAFNQPGPE